MERVGGVWRIAIGFGFHGGVAAEECVAVEVFAI
jgi:hypothetical protein